MNSRCWHKALIEIRSEDDDGLQRGLVPERSSGDIEKSLLDRIDRAKTADERDGLYLQLAVRTADKGDMRARDFTDKIDNMELRNQAKPYVDMTLAINVIEKKELKRHLPWLQSGS